MHLKKIHKHAFHYGSGGSEYIFFKYKNYFNLGLF